MVQEMEHEEIADEPQIHIDAGRFKNAEYTITKRINEQDTKYVITIPDGFYHPEIFTNEMNDRIQISPLGNENEHLPIELKYNWETKQFVLLQKPYYMLTCRCSSLVMLGFEEPSELGTNMNETGHIFISERKRTLVQLSKYKPVFDLDSLMN